MPLIIIMHYANGECIAVDAKWSADSLTHPDKSILWVLRAECGCELIGTTHWPCPRHASTHDVSAAWRSPHVSPES